MAVSAFVSPSVHKQNPVCLLYPYFAVRHEYPRFCKISHRDQARAAGKTSIDDELYLYREFKRRLG
jgi:hypothetical protein